MYFKKLVNFSCLLGIMFILMGNNVLAQFWCTGFGVNPIVTNVSCKGNDGSITANASGGSTPYKYTWSNGATTPSISNLSPGTYDITVKDKLGCSQKVRVFVILQANPILSMAKVDASCTGNADGRATVSASGGSAPYSYIWNTNPQQTKQTANGLSVGPYSVTVTDSKGCTAITSVNISQPPTLLVSQTQTNVSCIGGKDGTATATATGGTAPYYYFWDSSPAQSTSKASNLAAGTYHVTVKDGSCSASGIELAVNGNFSNNTTGFSSSYGYCNSGNCLWNEGLYAVGANAASFHNNFIGTDHTSGSGNFMIVNGAGTPNKTVWCQSIAVAPNTNYVFSTWVSTMVVSSPAQLQFSINGSNLGSVFSAPANINNWSEFYTIWNSGPNTTANICIVNQNTTTSGNDFGLDDISFQACNSTCSMVLTYNISEPTAIFITNSQTNVLCNGKSDGTATVSVSGGTPPYTYAWSHNAALNSNSAAGLKQGNYTITVTDKNLCKQTTIISITEPLALSASIVPVNVLCHGASTGSATANPLGGTSPYTYLWSTVPTQSSQIASGLKAGTYQVTVTDKNLCTTPANTSLTENTAITSIKSKTDVSCNLGSDGSASVNVSGGKGPYSYSWSNIGAPNTASQSGLKTGTYYVTITDINLCVHVDTLKVSEPSKLSAVVSTHIDVSCFGGNDGKIVLTSNGGTMPYKYSWSSSALLKDSLASNLVKGSYTITITDAKNCTFILTSILAEAAAITLSSSSTSALCFGSADGTASVIASGGSGNYLYSWGTVPPQTTATAVGLKAGSYSVTVADAASTSCTKTITVSVSEPSLLTASISKTDVKCKAGSTGTAKVTGTGGTGAYAYLWSNGKTTQSVSGLKAIVYSVTVTDVQGCKAITQISIGEPTVLLASILTSTRVSCNGGSDGSATAQVSGGTKPYTYSWNSTPTQSTIKAISLNADTFLITVLDSNKCKTTASVIITQPTALSATTSKTDVSCKNGTDGTASVIVSGGTLPYTYSWNSVPPQNTSTANSLKAGTYTVSITDSSQCPLSKTVIVSEPTALSTAMSKQDAKCKGSSDGTATVTASGGTSPYTYVWNTSVPQTTAIATGLTAGIYQVTTSDQLNCTKVDTIAVSEPSLLTASISKTDVKCKAGSTGTAKVTGAGGTGAYTYLWSNGKTTQSVSGLKIGNYSVSLIDINSCTVSVSTSIIEPTALIASLSKQIDVSCNAYSDGSASVLVGGGTPSYICSWNTIPPQIGLTASSLKAGSYSATITDSNGCKKVVPVSISEPAGMSISSTVQNVSCFNGNDGSALAVVTGGTKPYLYSWNTLPPQTTVNATSLIADTFVVTVTDSNSCNKSLSIVVNQSSALSSILTKTDVLCHGGNDGATKVVVSGGNAPYTYLWSSSVSQTNAIANNLSSGTYHLTITDNLNCIKVDSVQVNEPSKLILSIVKTDAKCKGGASGTASANASGGISPYTFIWSNGKTTQNISSLKAGSFSVTVTDKNGCTINSLASIGEPSALIGSITTLNNVSCFGGNDGSAMAIVSGGTKPYSYSWNCIPSQNGDTAISLAADTFQLTVLDSNKCKIIKSVIITQPVILSATISKTAVSCHGGSDATATLTVSGGVKPYSYIWSTLPVQSLSKAINLFADTFSVLISDSNQCKLNKNIIITEPSAITTSLTKVDANCNGSNDGSATVIASGGTSPYTYLWNTTVAQTTAKANALLAGKYQITVTDKNNCVKTDSIYISEPGKISLAFTHKDALCKGGLTGSANLQVSGGSAPFTFLWSNAKTTQNITGLKAGTYTVSVTDDHSCQASSSIVIGEPLALGISISSQQNVSCNGYNDGSVSVSVIGGTPSYNYIWNTNPVQTGFTASNLTAGNYSLLLTDSNGCKKTLPIIITEPLGMSISFSQQNVSCNGGNDANATVTVSGGTAPYAYLWNTSPNQTTQKADKLSAGIYQVTVSDSKLCQKTVQVTISEPLALSVSITPSNVSCFSGSDGSISSAVVGGTAPYKYLWSNSAASTTANLNTVVAGNYSLIITDTKGCTATASTSIIEPSLLTVSTLATDALCNNSSTGTATANPLGGAAPYTFSWNTSPVKGSQSVTGLKAGVYNVVVTDDKGCTANANAVIGQPTGLTASISGKINASCNGYADGSANVIAGGGIPSYTYQWSTSPIQTNSSATALAAGPYTVTVTDANGCKKSAVVTITEPSGMTLSSSQKNVSCQGGNDGNATISVLGGTSPYTFQWNTTPVQTTKTASSLSKGIYQAIVTDANSCQKVLQISISEPLLLSVISTPTDVSCFGGSNGSMNATPSGGTPPYSYLWSTSIAQTTQLITGLVSGSYTVTLTDNKSCTASFTANILEPSAISANITITNALCYSSSNGTAKVLVSGGKAPYTYIWSNGSTNQNQTALKAGNYTISITDANACKYSSSISIGQPTIIKASIINQVNASCNGYSDGAAEVSASGGILPYTYSWNSTPVQIGITATGLKAGNYSVVVSDSNLCKKTVSFVITEPAGMNVITSVTDANCFSGKDGTASVNISGGTPPYIYLWNTVPVQTEFIARNLASGSYDVTITDTKGCSKFSTLKIGQPADFVLFPFIKDVSCFSGNNGSIAVHPTGGTPPYQYSWSGGIAPQTDSISGLSTGLYTLTLTDSKSCIVTTSYTVQEPLKLLASVSVISDVNCFGGKDGILEVIPSDGSAPYTYKWNSSPAQTTKKAINLKAGTYTVTVSDKNKCVVSAQGLIGQPFVVDASIGSKKNVSCKAGNDGSISINTIGGIAPYTYQWNPGGSGASTWTQLSAGKYQITVTDAHSCIDTLSVFITEPPLLIAGILSSIDVNCFSGNDGSAIAKASGGTSPYSYQWSSGSSGITATGLIAGIYQMSCTDNNLCTATASVQINQPADIQIKIKNILNVGCNSGSDGKIDIGVVGGVKPYLIKWFIPGGKDSSAIGLKAGSYKVRVTDAHACTDSLLIVVTEPPVLNSIIFAKKNVSCFGGNDGMAGFTVSGGYRPYTYLWSGLGLHDSVSTNLKSGKYYFLITDGRGCVTKDSVIITQPDLIITTTTGSDSICIGKTVNIGASSVGGSGNYSYSWDQGLGAGNFFSLSPTVTTIYTVQTLDQNGCKASPQQVKIFVYQPLSVILSGPDSMCQGNKVSIYAQSYGGDGKYTFSWNQGLGPGPGAFQVSPSVTTMYVVSLSDQCGTASVSDTILLEVNPIPQIVVSTDLFKGCQPLTVNFKSFVQPASNNLSYLWNFGDNNFCNSDSCAHTYMNPGTFNANLLVTTSKGCMAMAQIPSAIYVYPKPVANFSSNPAVTTILHPDIQFTNLSEYYKSCLWSFGDGAISKLDNPQHTYSDTGIFNVELLVNNSNNCPDTIDGVIIVSGDFTFFIPNSFSPNEDGINDFFMGYGVGITQLEMYIFDRWGNQIFISSDQGKPWNGKVDGAAEVSQIDVYTYLFNVWDMNHQIHSFTGSVTLVR